MKKVKIEKKVKMVWNCQKSGFQVANDLPHEILCGKKIQMKKIKIVISQKFEIFWSIVNQNFPVSST